ncbi:ACP S-malonyltransferase [Streptomyces litchfieldiae]|uniref:[acyl-carrier-protein] S-malonyltransferase n=1 Tax=Streptomyces litchfieldiae TaxID=3075543 RepID=A0ABU2MX92_9ACTN|nr:ACP S-malonyltransferase [Streptomyces sp. DSM 44938]MDT0346262.1 ACP S-malonyltransferase [Streptomyces sp. DSM 44938]
MLVLVAPGQGSQAPGFLNPWVELPGVADRLGAWSDLVGLDLIHFGTKADADEIRDTAVAQPLLVAAALVSAAALFDDEAVPAPRAAVGAVAGHSVGELAAAAIAGVLSEEDAMALVRRRAQAMAEAAAVTETGMSAVLGGDPDAVAARLAELELTPANNNGGGQIVAAGTVGRLAELAAGKPERARVVPLKVAGAFHTYHMAPAVAEMNAAVSDISVADPGIRYVSNADGAVVAEGREVVRRLVSQISNPVRWDLCMETFQKLGATAIVELCPGGTLTALAKRNLPEVERVAIKGPDTLAAARELITGLSADTAAAADAAE